MHRAEVEPGLVTVVLLQGCICACGTEMHAHHITPVMEPQTPKPTITHDPDVSPHAPEKIPSRALEKCVETADKRTVQSPTFSLPVNVRISAMCDAVFTRHFFW